MTFKGTIKVIELLQTELLSGELQDPWSFYWQFSQNWSYDFYFVYSFVGMILINCQEMGFIELLKRSFSRSERSGLAYFPIIIDIIQ